MTLWRIFFFFNLDITWARRHWNVDEAVLLCDAANWFPFFIIIIIDLTKRKGPAQMRSAHGSKLEYRLEGGMTHLFACWAYSQGFICICITIRFTSDVSSSLNNSMGRGFMRISNVKVTCTYIQYQNTNSVWVLSVLVQEFFLLCFFLELICIIKSSYCPGVLKFFPLLFGCFDDYIRHSGNSCRSDYN